MKPSKAAVILSELIIPLALVATVTGLFWQGSGTPFAFNSLRGETVPMFGQGLYRYDTLFAGAGARGTDAVLLFAGVPTLIVAILLYGRGSLRGAFLLTGILAGFLYHAASMAFGAAYNNLFLLYILYFSASLFAFILTLTSIDRQALPERVSDSLPRRGIVVLLILAGLAVVFLWTSDILGGLAQGKAPQTLATYTTIITYVLDLGIIAPTVFLTSVQLLQRKPLGYLLSAPLLILLALIGLVVVGQTVAQLLYGITFTPGALIGLIGSWIVLGLAAIGYVLAFFRSLSEADMAASEQADQKALATDQPG